MLFDACWIVSVPLIVFKNTKLEDITPIRATNNRVVVIIDIG